MATRTSLAALALSFFTLSIVEGYMGISFQSNFNGYTDILITNSGPVKGKQVTVLGEDVEVYLGIPYAQPPLGDLRFKIPVPVETWKDVLLATHISNSCSQQLVYPSYFDEWNTKAPLSEDCLFLNIWVPKKLRDSRNASVLIWIHGGGYFTGASTLEQYDGAYLAATNDVIVASVNYRVGALGFLHLGFDEAPGNMGLFDQHLAIKWIKENVESFGGNPDSLTLFGESAGGGSVSFHLLSPMTTNLTRRFIMQSGTANMPWSFKTSEEAKNNAFELANLLGCQINRIDSNAALAVVECLRALPVRNITFEQDKMIKLGMDFPFVPTVDGVFLPKSPEQLLLEGKFKGFEAIVGTTKDEGSMFAAYEQAQYFNENHPIGLTNEQHSNILKITFSDTKLRKIEKELMNFQYTDWECYGNETANAKMIVHVFGDYFFICPASYFAQKLKEGGAKVFYYSFDQAKSVRKLGAWMGASHTDDIEFIFGAPLGSAKNYTESEKILSLKMMSYFTSFAKNGAPLLDECEWPEYSSEHQTYMILHETGSRLSQNGPRATACAFWNSLMPSVKTALKACHPPQTVAHKEREGEGQ